MSDSQGSELAGLTINKSTGEGPNNLFIKYKILTVIYLPIYLCDSSGSSDSCDSCDSSDSSDSSDRCDISDSSDSCDSSERRKKFFPYFSPIKIVTKLKKNQIVTKLKNSNCDKTQKLKL